MTINARRAMVGALMCSAGLFAQAISPAIGLADEPVCPYGTYWNPAVSQCLPIGVNPVIGPAGPIGVGGVVGPVGPGPVGPGPVGPGPVGPGPMGPGGLGPR
ncbi:hypothetical protein [Mycolicibacterium diernhoferi]|uniref:hypothetical protein n=1 Tax=Mycolicibacterium diernhoferi TaxID=1801 RepID=UPI0009609B23|nr:hypothetical protein [Mycolicibacterium diernhoferi]OJZ68262.1 hypothetical protein BRW64_01355 [Mycolicibacterium diernhoferi]QYL21239.1 hypothetical protein K0O62_19685 [Mycolicibacterium diernhoferi]